MPRQKHKPTLIASIKQIEIRRQFMAVFSEIYPQALRELLDDPLCRETWTSSSWAVKFGLQGTWVEDIARQTIVEESRFGTSSWVISAKARNVLDDGLGSARTLSVDVRVATLLEDWDLAVKIAHNDLVQQMMAIKDEGVRLGHATVEVLPKTDQLTLKFRVYILHRCQGLTLLKISEEDHCWADVSNLSRWIKSVRRIAQLP